MYALAACCAHLAAQPVFGLDTEFIGENTFHPTLCLAQVATVERLYLIDPLACGPLDAFWALVADPARTVVVEPGVDLDRFRPGPADRVRLGLPPTGRIVAFVGRIQPLKGPDVLLRAAAELIRRDPAMRDPRQRERGAGHDRTSTGSRVGSGVEMTRSAHIWRHGT